MKFEYDIDNMGLHDMLRLYACNMAGLGSIINTLHWNEDLAEIKPFDSILTTKLLYVIGNKPNIDVKKIINGYLDDLVILSKWVDETADRVKDFYKSVIDEINESFNVYVDINLLVGVENGVCKYSKFATYSGDSWFSAISNTITNIKKIPNVNFTWKNIGDLYDIAYKYIYSNKPVSIHIGDIDGKHIKLCFHNQGSKISS